MNRRTGTSIMLAGCCGWFWGGAAPAFGQAGACCGSLAMCTMETASACQSDGSTFLGTGTDCIGVDCSGLTGACCVAPGICISGVTIDACEQGGNGTYFGHGTSCPPGTNCLSTSGACCFGTICASTTSQGACQTVNGTFLGNGTTCQVSPDPCNPPQRGACCFPNACIDDVTADGCANATGTYKGDGSACVSVVCGVCGDNAVNLALGEECDGTDDAACTCSSCHPPGHPTECTCAPAAVCGNDILEECETCDGTDDAACPGRCDTDCTCMPQPLAVKWFTVDSGGGTSTGGTFTVRSTIGQHDAGAPLTGATYKVSGGFWPPLPAASLAEPPLSAPAPHDRRKNRYLSFAPNNTADVAFRVQRVAPPPAVDVGWVGVPNVEGIAKIEAAPVFRTWTEGVIHAGDCEVIPVANYTISATVDETAFSEALTVDTIALPSGGKFWGDTVGSFDGVQWSAPNNIVNANDFLAALQKFQNLPSGPHVTVVDVQSVSSIDPCLNRITNIADVFLLIQAFQGSTYPFSTNPLNCPPCP